MSIPTITALPPAPDLTSPTTFNSLATTLMAAIEDTFVDEMNATVTAINAVAVQIEATGTYTNLISQGYLRVGLADTAASPSIFHNSDQDTGLFWGGDGVLAVASNGVEIAHFVDGSGLSINESTTYLHAVGANWGIDISGTPAEKLDVNGKIRGERLILDGATAPSVYASSATATVTISGGSIYNQGAQLNLYGESHATQAGDIRFRNDTQNVYQWDDSANAHYWYDNAGAADLELNGNSSFRPGTDDELDLGTAGRRWAEVFSAIGTINTSDARLKTDVEPLSKSELAAARDLVAEVGTFQFLKSLDKKGDDARRHCGMTVQRAIEIMEQHGLDPTSYGFVCYDSWEATEDVIAEDVEEDPETGEPITVETLICPGQEAGDVYSFRPDQLTMFMLRGLAERISELEARTGRRL